MFAHLRGAHPPLARRLPAKTRGGCTPRKCSVVALLACCVITEHNAQEEPRDLESTEERVALTWCTPPLALRLSVKARAGCAPRARERRAGEMCTRVSSPWFALLRVAGDGPEGVESSCPLRSTLKSANNCTYGPTCAVHIPPAVSTPLHERLARSRSGAEREERHAPELALSPRRRPPRPRPRRRPRGRP